MWHISDIASQYDHFPKEQQISPNLSKTSQRVSHQPMPVAIPLADELRSRAGMAESFVLAISFEYTTHNCPSYEPRLRCN